MNVSNYTAFFHDGAILDIKHEKNKIQLFMESAQIDEEDLKEEHLDDIILSNDERIRGELHIEEIKSININNKLVDRIIKKNDYGRIFDLELTHSSIKLLLEWVSFSPKLEGEFMTIKILAEKIYWENIPDLVDQ